MDFAGQLGSLFLVSGVIAAFTRFFALSGEFRSALAEVVAHPDVAVNRTDRRVIWQRLTLSIHLQDFVPSGAIDELFVEDLQCTLDRLLMPRPYFLRNCIAEHTFTPLEGSLVQISTIFHYQLVSLRGKNELPVDVYFGSLEGLQAVEYELGATEVYVDEQPVTVREERGKDYVKLFFACAGKDTYNIKRRRSFVQDISKDSSYRFISSCVVHSIDVTVNCLGHLSTAFVEVGVEQNAFENFLSAEVRQARLGDHNRRYRGILLPRQGMLS